VKKNSLNSNTIKNELLDSVTKLNRKYQYEKQRKCFNRSIYVNFDDFTLNLKMTKLNSQTKMTKSTSHKMAVSNLECERFKFNVGLLSEFASEDF